MVGLGVRQKNNFVKTITLKNYKTDKYYTRIVRAVSAILMRSDFVTPVDLFTEIGILHIADLKNWRHGRVPYLEKVIHCNLSVANRVLCILRMHAHDLNLRPSMTVYNQWGKATKTRLRFTKTNTKNIEDAYACHFVRLGKKKFNASSESTKKENAEPDDATNPLPAHHQCPEKTNCKVALLIARSL